MGFSFYEKQNKRILDSAAVVVNRSVDIYKKDDTWCVVLRTSSSEEFTGIRNRLKKMDFYCYAESDTCSSVPLLFQKKTITIQAICSSEDGEPVYTFVIKKKDMILSAHLLLPEERSPKAYRCGQLLSMLKIISRKAVSMV